MKIFLRVRYVDMDGYCGRDLHPSREMLGREVLLLGILWLNSETFPLTLDAVITSPREEMEQMFTCDVDGELVEFMGHEVEFSRVEV